MNYVFSTENLKRYRFPTHINDLVMDRSESSTSEAFVVIIEPGSAPPLHRHADTEQVFFILEGNGNLEIQDETKHFPVSPGNLVRVPPKTYHTIRAVGNLPLKYLAIDCFTAERLEDEPTWDDHVRVLCKEQGWNFDQVVAGK